MNNAIFFILCLEGAVLSFNVAAAAALIPSVSAAFGVSQVFAGQATWLYMFPYGAAALVYGPLTRIFEIKKIELACLGLFALSNLWAALSVNISHFFCARFFMGLFGASVTPLVLILIARLCQGNNRGKFVGIFFASSFFASLLGLFLSGIVSWRLIFLIPAIVGALLWLWMFFKLPNFAQHVGGAKINYLALLKNKKALALFSYIFCVSLVYHGVQQWLSVYFSSRFGFGQFLISMLITLTSLSGVFGELIGGHLADSLGRFKTVELGIILMIFGALVLIFKLPVYLFALVMIIWGLGWTLNHAGLSTILTDLPHEFLNEAAGLNSSVRFLAGGLGVAIGGLLLNKSFILFFTVFGTGLILLAFLARNFIQEVRR